MIQVDDKKFALGHSLFEECVTDGGERPPFSSFGHSWLVEDEIEYKWAVMHQAKEVLELRRWPKFRRTPGVILDRLKRATATNVSRNLLEHRWGEQKSLRMANDEQIPELERLIHELFLAGPRPEAEFGVCFDALAEFLRDERLGCQWAFMAYLAFISNGQRYFPVLPSKFDALLRFYGNDVAFEGRVEWARYEFLLELADILRERLAMYGRPNAIEIQSYMYVVARSVAAPMREQVEAPSVNWDAELERRIARAQTREETGLRGERLVAKGERDRLTAAHRPDLAKRVRLVSINNESSGYDLHSFEIDGSELHIEVKTTSLPRVRDRGFFLSEGERRAAEQDPAWRLYRVWDVDVEPEWVDLGNIVTNSASGWVMEPSSWMFRPVDD